jgi:hypothetical protein
VRSRSCPVDIAVYWNLTVRCLEIATSSFESRAWSSGE